MASRVLIRAVVTNIACRVGTSIIHNSVVLEVQDSVVGLHGGHVVQALEVEELVLEIVLRGAGESAR